MITPEKAQQFVRDTSAEPMAKLDAKRKVRAKYTAVLAQVESNISVLNDALRHEGHPLWDLELSVCSNEKEAKLTLRYRYGVDAHGSSLFRTDHVGFFSYNSALDSQRVYFTDADGCEHVLELSSESTSPTSVDSVLLKGVALVLARVL